MKIISIGPTCTSAQLIKFNNYKTESYIFDWSRSNILSVIDILKYGENFHIDCNIEKKKNIQYKNKLFSFISYPHHNYIKDKDYMIRCSNRFFNILNSNEDIKFLYMCDMDNVSVDPLKEHSIKDVELNELIRLLNNYKCNYEIIMVYNVKKGDKIKLIKKEDKYRIYHCNYHERFYSNNMQTDYYKYIFNYIFCNKKS